MGKVENQRNKRVGFEYFNNQNEKVKIIEYNRYSDIVVQFEDGTTKRSNCNLVKQGLPLNPNRENPYKTKRLWEETENTQGCKMKVVEYRNANDIDIQFSDGTVIKNREYDEFIKGSIFNPNWGIGRIGEKRISTQGEEIELIDFISFENVTVRFEDGTIAYNRRYDHFKTGNIKNYNKVYLYDRGYLGIGKYEKKSLQGRKWTSMFDRCYKETANNRTYKGTSVSEKWYSLQDFGKWFDENLWSEDCTFLDKDILFKGNAVYSPKTCVLVDNYINCFFAYKREKQSNLPTGVVKETENSYRAYLHHKGESVLRQWFKTPQEAFASYKKEKEKLAKEIAEEYNLKYPNFPKSIYNALYNFKVEE